MKFLCLVLWVNTLFISIVIADQTSPYPQYQFKCHYVEQLSVDVTGDSEYEDVKLSIFGDDCDSAIFNITIISNDAILYSFSKQFKNMHQMSNDDEAAKFVFYSIEKQLQTDAPTIKSIVQEKAFNIIQDYYVKNKSLSYLNVDKDHLVYISHPSSFEDSVYLTYNSKLLELLFIE